MQLQTPLMHSAKFPEFSNFAKSAVCSPVRPEVYPSILESALYQEFSQLQGPVWKETSVHGTCAIHRGPVFYCFLLFLGAQVPCAEI